MEAQRWERHWELTDALMAIPGGPPAAAIPELFSVMEGMPDADLGSPGPLVHPLEALKEYQAELMRSVRRSRSMRLIAL